MAAVWAELELREYVADKQAHELTLMRIDGRSEARESMSRILDQFEALLGGAEEQVHQFLKNHPQLLSYSFQQFWSKLEFGEFVSDFVFREPGNDYVLVEIEAPVQMLFRKDGHPRATLQHPIDQIRDWVAYINDNRAEVEQKYGLTGISASPRMLVVIGRSLDLTEKNRRKIKVMEDQTPRLRIRTYDDILVEARAYIERALGPLGFRGPNSRFFWKPRA